MLRDVILPTRVIECQRIIDAVRVPVQCLRIIETLYHRIRADKPPNGCIIIPGTKYSIQPSALSVQ
jgi:hypothetical protein